MVKFNYVSTGILVNSFFREVINQENGNIKNQDPKFKKADKNLMNIQAGSAAIGKAVSIIPTFSDILNKPRTNPSDIGAYNFIP